ncbi:hypothetical protein C8R43DRAFT_1020153 [Mycena crocata]|nr:hypothetical protein C8R43DRAFT_1020153 [Mycena crocata]
MIFTAYIPLFIATAITTITGAIVIDNSARGGVLPPNYSDLDNAPPRKDQTDGVICDVGQFSKTTGIEGTARDQNDGAYEYLVGLDGTANQDPGPGKCSRVSCAWDLGVYFCNDNDHPISVPWKEIAKFANDIGMTCGGGVHLPSSTGRDDYGRDYFDWTKTKKTNGQKFSGDRWNVYLNGDKC